MVVGDGGCSCSRGDGLGQWVGEVTIVDDRVDVVGGEVVVVGPVLVLVWCSCTF